jgi:uncharacterized protein YcaQ
MVTLTLTAQEARRLAVAGQRLEDPQPNPAKADILDTIRQITCLQLDPINVVARTQLLVLFSRLGQYNPADLEELLWDDKVLFEYWAHAASIVLADDYPIFRPQMHQLKRSGGEWGRRTYEWLEANAGFRRRIFDELAARGPLYADEFESRADAPWPHDNRWGGGRDISIMLDMLWARGYVTVTRRTGNGFGLKKQWGLMEHQLGSRVHEPPVEQPRLVRLAVERALRALGPARVRDIKYYFTRGEYPGLPAILKELEAQDAIRRVGIHADDGELPGPWYLHNDLLPELERLRRGEWRPQIVLLSPFDNLIADRNRTELLFNFFYRVEIYTPAAKRQYGYYVMPILHGDRLIGRVDPKMDRQAGRLIINAVHWEPGISIDDDTRAAVEGAVASLAGFLGAEGIDFPNQGL